MESRVFHSLNAGLYFETEFVNIIIDGIHGGSGVGMSDVPEEIVSWITQTKKKTLLLFTHLHEDHFHRELVEKVLDENPNTDIFSPETVQAGLAEKLMTEGYAEFDYYGTKIGVLPTVHQGENFSNVQHFSYFINTGDKSCFAAGDGILGQKEWNLLLKRGKKFLDIVFCNTFHLSSEKSIAFVKNMAPAEAALYHLPRQEDDRYNYWILAQNNRKQYPEGLPPFRQLKHMSWIEPAEQ